jgi:hypothetical protein
VTTKLRKEVASSKRTPVPMEVSFAKMSASRLPAGMRERVMASEKDAAVALSCLRKEVSQHAKTLKRLNLAQEDLNAMVKKLVPNTNWIEKCGKKGQRCDIFIVEMGLQLVSQNMNAEQCVYAFGVFMQMTYPTLTSGEDYRLPTVSAFKEWGEMLYPIAVNVNRSRLDLAIAIYYHHDDSPRGGYSWHGSTSVCTFKDDDGHVFKEHIPLGVEVLSNGKHGTMAAEGVSIMGANLRKMCLVMSDAAALDVARMMYDEKDALVQELAGVAWSKVDKEINETNFVAQCINHGGDNASKDHFKGVQKEMLRLIIKYNCATLIQHWWLTRVLYWRMLRHKKGQTVKGYWRSKTHWRMTTTDRDEAAARMPGPAAVVEPPSSAAPLRCISVRSFALFFLLPPPDDADDDLAISKVWQGLLYKVLTNSTGRKRFHCSMELQRTEQDGSVLARTWVLAEKEVHDVWALMRSMSNLISNQGSHSKYWLNESKQMRLFWAKHELENGVSGDTDALVGLPAWANNRFGIRQELSFYLIIAWDATMT